MRASVLIMVLLAAFAGTASAQGTSFNYQGRITESGAPGNGSFQMQFKLFDALTSGTQIGSTITNSDVTVADGVFSIRLDFGSSPFSGADRYLEIAVRRNSSQSYTVLSPRQQIASSPYSIRTLSAAQADVALDSQKLGGVNASEYVTNSSTSFIRNQSTVQSPASFNISGNGSIAGNLGVGVTFPTSKVDIVGQDGLRVTGFQPFITLRESGNNLTARIQSANGELFFRPNAGGTSEPAMYISQDGRIAVGNILTLDRFQVFGDIRAGTSGSNGCLKNFNGGGIAGTCSSDIRYKRDILPFGRLLSRFVQLRPVSFYWLEERVGGLHFGKERETGLIAQEVEKLFPELVASDENGYRAVKYSNLPLLSIEAIKELKAENDELARQMAAQALEISRLKKHTEIIEHLKQLACKTVQNTSLGARDAASIAYGELCKGTMQ